MQNGEIKMKTKLCILKKSLSPSFFSIPTWVWIAWLPTFIVRVAIAWAPVNQSFGLSVPDDAYYYFTIARNVALGNGVTSDGLAPTNGFHPLWMVLITPLWWIAGQSNQELPVHMALTLGAILDVITMIGIWNLGGTVIRRRLIGGLAVLAYAWNPYNVAASVNGLETSLGAVLFVWSLVVYWRIRTDVHTAWRDWLVLGLAWSLLLLARTDYLVVIIPCGLDLAWQFRRSLRNIWPFAVGGLVWVPWLTWNFSTFRSFSQVSGNAYPYYLHAIWQAEHHTLSEWFVHEARLGYGILTWLGILSGFNKGIVVFAIAVGWLLIDVVLRGRHIADSTSNERSTLSGLVWPTVGAITLLLIHGLVRWMYIPWYFIPTIILLILWFGVLLDRLADTHIVWALIVAGVYFGFQLLHSVHLWNQGGMWASQRQAIEKQMPQYSALCERYDTVGISDSGYAGYYLPCRIVNLDGVVNNEAFAAIVHMEFRDYLDKAQIDYVVLNEIVRNVVEMEEGAIPNTAPFASK